MKYLKQLRAALAGALALAAAGCTAVQEAGDDVSNKFEQGITGQGRFIAPNQMGDQFGSYYQ